MRTLSVLMIMLFLAGYARAQSSNANTTNWSLSITTGGAFQTVLASVAQNAQRRSLTIQNNNTAPTNCWVYIGSGPAALATSILLTSGGSYSRFYPWVPNDQIQATCTTAGNTLYVDTQ